MCVCAWETHQCRSCCLSAGRIFDDIHTRAPCLCHRTYVGNRRFHSYMSLAIHNNCEEGYKSVELWIPHTSTHNQIWLNPTLHCRQVCKCVPNHICGCYTIFQWHFYLCMLSDYAQGWFISIHIKWVIKMLFFGNFLIILYLKVCTCQLQLPV